MLLKMRQERVILKRGKMKIVILKKVHNVL